MPPDVEIGKLVQGRPEGEFTVDNRQGFGHAFSSLTMALADPTGYGVCAANDTFEMHPYCWCGEDTCPQCGTGTQVNFWHKPSGFRLNWYKYPMRSADMNQNLSLEAFTAIVEECVSSVFSSPPNMD